MKSLVLALLRVYRYAISPMLGRNCRFVPSCSEYAVEAVERHGALKGGWLAARRVPLPSVQRWRLRPGPLSLPTSPHLLPDTDLDG
jgi:putative membrane protein insertion efficiency factor